MSKDRAFEGQFLSNGEPDIQRRVLRARTQSATKIANSLRIKGDAKPKKDAVTSRTRSQKRKFSLPDASDAETPVSSTPDKFGLQLDPNSSNSEVFHGFKDAKIPKMKDKTDDLPAQTSGSLPADTEPGHYDSYSDSEETIITRELSGELSESEEDSPMDMNQNGAPPLPPPTAKS